MSTAMRRPSILNASGSCRDTTISTRLRARGCLPVTLRLAERPSVLGIGPAGPGRGGANEQTNDDNPGASEQCLQRAHRVSTWRWTLSYPTGGASPQGPAHHPLSSSWRPAPVKGPPGLAGLPSLARTLGRSLNPLAQSRDVFLGRKIHRAQDVFSFVPDEFAENFALFLATLH